MSIDNNVYEIQNDNGQWLKVSDWIFRSWTGKRRKNGLPFAGAVYKLGTLVVADKVNRRAAYAR